MTSLLLSKNEVILEFFRKFLEFLAKNWLEFCEILAGILVLDILCWILILSRFCFGRTVLGVLCWACLYMLHSVGQ